MFMAASSICVLGVAVLSRRDFYGQMAGSR